MRNLFEPLEEFASFAKEEKQEEKEAVATRIPIPSPDYLKKMQARSGTDTDSNVDYKMVKYKDQYELFCKWAALPKLERKPPTAVAFEKKYMLPKNYTEYFKSRNDFTDKRLNYFWEWMMELYPDVVHAVYKRAVSKGGSKDAQIFIELLSKKMQLDRPKVQVQPMVLMGVPQDKIDALFVPKGYEAGVIPGAVTTDETKK